MAVKVKDGAIRMPNTLDNIEEIEKYLRGLIKKSGKTTHSGKPSKPKDLPKVYLDNEQFELRNKAAKGDLSTNRFKLDPAKARAKSGLKRTVNEAFPGQKVTPRTRPDVAAARTGITDHIREWAGELGYEDAQIEKYEFDLAEELRSQGKKVNKANIDAGGTFWTTGHDNPLEAGGINSPRGTRLQNLSGNTADSSKFRPNPATLTAVGNPTGGKTPIENWKRDFLFWADRPENGGDGLLPQRRRTYTPKVEAEFDALNKKGLSPNKLVDAVDDKIASIEAKKVFNPKILQSANLVKKMSKIATGAGTAEAGVMLASGQVVPGGIALAMQTPAVQKQVAKLLLKQGVKLIPGLSFGGGLIQGAGYAASGRPLKATASVLGGIVGEIPGIGDVAQSLIDLGLTVDDVRVAKQKAKTKPELEVNEKGFMHTPVDETTDPALAKTIKDLGEDVSQFDRSGIQGSTRINRLIKTGKKIGKGVTKGI